MEVKMRLEEYINQRHKELNENELTMVSYILDHQKECQHLSIVELAKRCHTSKSSIHRLMKKLGFSGFSEFKYILKNTEETSMVSKDLIQLQIEDIEATLKLMKQSDVKTMVEVMAQAERIFGFGTGWGQRNALKELSRNLMRVGKHVLLIPAKTEFDLLMPTITENDFMIIVSLSGDGVGIEPMLHFLNLKGTPILAITAFKSNLLAQKSSYNLYYYATPLNEQASHKTISFVTLNVVCDVLFREYLVHGM